MLALHMRGLSTPSNSLAIESKLESNTFSEESIHERRDHSTNKEADWVFKGEN